VRLAKACSTHAEVGDPLALSGRLVV